MGRLTERDKNEQGIWVEDSSCNYHFFDKYGDMYSIINKLAHYEDLEETLMKSAEIDIDSMVGEFMHYYNLQKENRLIELPCKFGDTVYEIHYDFPDDDYTYSCPYYYIHEVKFTIDSLAGWEEWVFLTKEEAEAKLKELEG